MAFATMELARKFSFSLHFKVTINYIVAHLVCGKNSRICFGQCTMGPPQLLIGFKYKFFFLVCQMLLMLFY